MGPCGQRLREIDAHRDRHWAIRATELFSGPSDPAWMLLDAAADRLGVDFYSSNDFDVDVFSEAIEAAEALGL